MSSLCAVSSAAIEIRGYEEALHMHRAGVGMPTHTHRRRDKMCIFP